MYYVDYHIHSVFSNDGFIEIDEACDKAVAEGFAEIAFADHYDPYTENPDCIGEYDPKAQLAAVEAAREKYAGKLKILYAVELGQSHRYPENAAKIVKNDYDYVLGAVHSIENDLDLARIKYTSSNFKAYMRTSYEHILEVAKLNLFDCLAHLDYPKRYMALHGLRVKPCDYMELIEEILKTVIANGKGIEVNCSGLRHRVNETLPNLEILKLYKSLGGEIITVGSDAHRYEHALLYIKETYEVMQAAGFDYITLFDKRIPKFVKF